MGKGLADFETFSANRESKDFLSDQFVSSNFILEQMLSGISLKELIRA
jgi:hypothetical protein